MIGGKMKNKEFKIILKDWNEFIAEKMIGKLQPFIKQGK